MDDEPAVGERDGGAVRVAADAPVRALGESGFDRRFEASDERVPGRAVVHTSTRCASV